MKSIKNIFKSNKKEEIIKELTQEFILLSNEYNILIKRALDGENVEQLKEEIVKKAEQLVRDTVIKCKDDEIDTDCIGSKLCQYCENGIMNSDVVGFVVMRLSDKQEKENNDSRRIR